MLFNVREKIRTPDTLVRSQVLYPAELRTHMKLMCEDYLCNSTYSTPKSYFCQLYFEVF